MKTIVLLIVLIVPPVSGGQLDRTAALIEELVNAPAPSGFEDAVRAIMARELEAAGVSGHRHQVRRFRPLTAGTDPLCVRIVHRLSASARSENVPSMAVSAPRDPTIRPDLGMALEVGVAGDHPGVSADEAQSKVGGGPSIFLYEASMLPNLKLRDLFVRVAEQTSIPLQMDIISRYGQDASQIQKYAMGTPTIAFGVPTRYLHTHTSMIDRSDFDRAVDLLVSILMQLNEKAVSDLAIF